jgi:hypothetical protein
VYIFLKFRLLQAKINKSIGMNHKAHDICNSIILFVKLFKDETPAKFWLTAVKAGQLHSVQLCNAKEFDDALLLLNNISQKITQMVGDHFLQTHASLELQNNYYSFSFRRYLAQYHIYFFDHGEAEHQLRKLLADEIEFYSGGKLKEQEVAEEAAEEVKTEEEQKKADVKREQDDNLLKKLEEFGLESMAP